MSTITTREELNKGCCVFALKDIVVGSTLEIAPYVYITAEQRTKMKGMDFGEYPFADPRFYKPHLPCRGMVVFGKMSFANHWWEPNAIVSWARDYAKLVALSNILKGDEIVIRYTDFVEYENTKAWSGPIKKRAARGPEVPVAELPV